LAGDAALSTLAHAIAAGRINFSDRRISRMEARKGALAKKQQSAVKVYVRGANGLKKPLSCGLIAMIARLH
jgi:hypothetical protein